MLPLLIPIGLAAGAGYLWHRHGKPHGMTPQRKQIYEEALKSLKDPAKLKALAEGFEKEGLKKEADLLRKRAALKERTPETKAAHQQVFRKAISSSNPEAVKKVADAFHGMGATGSAARLYTHEAGLRRSQR